MSNNNLTRIVPKNYQSFIEALPGAAMWRHLYVANQFGDEIDVTENGNKSCAYMVSSVLCIFQLIDMPHATVKTTLGCMEKAGWEKINEPIKGSVVHWEDHLGFYLADDFVISNSSSSTSVARHGLVRGDGQKPLDFYIHPTLLLK